MEDHRHAHLMTMNRFFLSIILVAISSSSSFAATGDVILRQILSNGLATNQVLNGTGAILINSTNATSSVVAINPIATNTGVTAMTNGGSYTINLTNPVTNAGLQKEIYISFRTDGVTGVGSKQNPFDGSTTAKFSSALRYAMNMSNTVVYIGPGTYGWSNTPSAISWQQNNIIKGSGRDITIIQEMQIPQVSNNVVMFQTTYSPQWNELHDITLDGGYTRLGMSSSMASLAIGSYGGLGLENVHMQHFGAGSTYPVEAFNVLANGGSTAPNTGSFFRSVICDSFDGSGQIDGLYMAAANTSNVANSPIFAQGTISECVVNLSGVTGQGIGWGGFVNVVNNFVYCDPTDASSDCFFSDTWIRDGSIISGNRSLFGQIGFACLAAGTGNSIRGAQIINNTAYINLNRNGYGFDFNGTNFTGNLISGNAVINVNTNTSLTNVQAMSIGTIGAGNIFAHNILDTNVTAGEIIYQNDSSSSNSFFSGNVTIAGTPIVPTYNSATPSLTNNGSGTLTSLTISTNLIYGGTNATATNQIGVIPTSSTLINQDQMALSLASGQVVSGTTCGFAPTATVGTGTNNTATPYTSWFINPGALGLGNASYLKWAWADLVGATENAGDQAINWNHHISVTFNFSAFGNAPATASTSVEDFFIGAGTFPGSLNTGAGIEFRYPGTNRIAVYPFGIPGGTTNYYGGGTNPLLTLTNRAGGSFDTISMLCNNGSYSVIVNGTNFATGLTVPSAANSGANGMWWGGVSNDTNLSGYRQIHFNRASTW